MKKIRFPRKRPRNMGLLLVAAAVVLPMLTSNGFLVSIGCYILLYSIVSMSNMLTVGYGGMMNMAQAAIYGVGAYTTAILSTRLGVPFLGCLLLSSLTAMLMGFLISVPCLRVKADFLGLITLAFHQLYASVAENWVSVTNGPMGIRNIPRIVLFNFTFSSQKAYYYLFLAITAGTYIVLKRFIRSPAGRAIQAVRDDEISAESAGIRVNSYKIMVFMAGSLFTGMAGCLYASYVGYVGSSTFTLETTFLLLEMNIVGGLGSLEGAIFGAAFFTIMPEIIRPLAVYRVGIGGLLMFLVVLIRPQGVLGSDAFSGDRGILKTRFKKLEVLWQKGVPSGSQNTDGGGAM